MGGGVNAALWTLRFLPRPSPPSQDIQSPIPSGSSLETSEQPQDSQIPSLRSLSLSSWTPSSLPPKPPLNPHSPLHDLQRSARMLRSTLLHSHPPPQDPQPPQALPQTLLRTLKVLTFRTPPWTLGTLPHHLSLSRTPPSILRAPRRSFRALPKDTHPTQDPRRIFRPPPPVTLGVHPAFRAAPGPPQPHLQLLQFEAEVDEPHHRVLLPLRVFGQRQDGAAALLDGAAQLLHVGRQDETLRRGRPGGEREKGEPQPPAAPLPPALPPPLTTGREKWSSARPRSMGRSEPSPSPWPGSCRRAASSGGAPGGSGSSSPAPPPPPSPPPPPGGSGPLLKGLRCACRNRASLSSYAIALRDAAPAPRGTARTGTGTGTGPPGGGDSAEPRPPLGPPLPLAPPVGRRSAQRWVGLRTASRPMDPVPPPPRSPLSAQHRGPAAPAARPEEGGPHQPQKETRGDALAPKKEQGISHKKSGNPVLLRLCVSGCPWLP